MIPWQALDVGNHRVPCPSCGRGPKDRTCGVTIEHNGKGVAHCYRCSHVETYRVSTPTIRPGKAVSRPVVPLKHETLSPWGQARFAEGVPPKGTIGEQYLRARGCPLPPADGDLRFHPELRHPSGHVGPALLALVTHVETGEPLTLHRTWITATGKANVEPARLLLKGHTKRMGVIRLWPDEAVTYSLAVGEGIETCLTLARVHALVWSLIDAGNLKAFPALPGIESLLIAADHDDAGLQAAAACADRWTRAGKSVRIVKSPTPKHDLNDHWRAAA